MDTIPGAREPTLKPQHAVLGFFAACCLGATPSAGAEPPRGLVVVRVETLGAADRGGIVAGDRLLACAGNGGGWALEAPHDVVECEWEMAERGPVTLSFLRRQERHETVLPAGRWRLEVESGSQTEQPLANLRHEQERLRQENADRADFVDNARRQVNAAEQLADRPLVAVRCRLELGLALGWAKLYDAGRATLADALAKSQAALPGGSLLEGEIEAGLATLALWTDELEEAESAAQRALALFESIDPDFEVAAYTLTTLGDIEWKNGAHEGALTVYERALTILKRRGDSSGMISNLLRGMGTLTERLADYPRADRYLEQAIEAAEPDSLAMARALGERGYLHISWWRLATARKYNEAAHRLFEKLGTEGPRLSMSHSRLGHTARFQGDLATAEMHYSKALEIQEHLGDEAEVGLQLANLGNLARQRRDYDTALSLYREALDRYDRDQKTYATTRARLLSNLGRALLLLGRANEAATLLEESLALKRQVTGTSPDVAASLMLLGDLERSRGRKLAARERYTEALAVHSLLIAGSPAEAENQVRLAQLEASIGDHARAEQLLQAAIVTLERRAPETTAAAEALYQLARLQHDRGRRQGALTLYRRAAEALDAQWQSLGGSTEARLAWMDGHTEIYRALLDLLVEEGLYDEAFDVLQRFRARVLRDILSQHSWQLPSTERGLEIETELIDLAREREALLSRQSPAQPNEVDALSAELSSLNGRRVRALAALRDEAPQRSRLERPNVLDLQQAGPALGLDTALVSYAVGLRSTIAFVLRRDANGTLHRAATRLPIGRERLRGEVEAFRAAIKRHAPDESSDVEAMGAALYRALLEPFEEHLGQSDRLLLVTDGPLHRLPFTALRRQGQYLIEWKPLHLAPSMSTYASLRHQVDPSTSSVAFGDAIYRGVPAATPAGRATRDPDLKPLPWTRFEVEELRRHLPAPVRVYLGREATEEQAKNLSDERLIHFAGHAALDQRRPLNSALVFSPPESGKQVRGEEEPENGLLYAWEIIEQMRLRASLVTLSACDTALGHEADGEGLLGLVWAFHYAGARSVVASLWNVEDRSTAELMSRFYAGLAEGLGKDDALRRAQVALIQGISTEVATPTRGVGGLVASEAENATKTQVSHPFYWAAFQLYGSIDE